MRSILTAKWSKVNACDRPCKNCPIFELCRGPETEGYNCPFLRCEVEAPTLRPMQVCPICHFGPISWDLSQKELSRSIFEISNVGNAGVRSPKIPDIVPIVCPLDLENRVRMANKTNTIQKAY